MAIWADNITDLTNATLEDLGENKIEDIATTEVDYPACRKLLNKEKISVQGGTSIRTNLIYQGDGNTRTTSLFGVDNIDHVDGTAKADIPWRGVTTGMSYDIDEDMINAGPREIYNFIKTKRYQRDISFVEAMEGYFWDGPTSSGDELTPFGLLNYWLDYDANEGFNGGNHTNFSSGPGGVDCATYSNWQHYTANYAAVTDSDLITKVRKALRRCNFKGIPSKPMREYTGGIRYGMYTTADTLESMEAIARSQNDNLGAELAMYQDGTLLKRVPIEWVPYLQKNHATSDPFIGLDWNSIDICALKNRFMVETPFKEAPNQHTVRVSHMDCRFNIVMRNRRKSFLIAKSDPMSD